MLFGRHYTNKWWYPVEFNCHFYWIFPRIFDLDGCNIFQIITRFWMMKFRIQNSFFFIYNFCFFHNILETERKFEGPGTIYLGLFLATTKSEKERLLKSALDCPAHLQTMVGIFQLYLEVIASSRGGLGAWLLRHPKRWYNQPQNSHE